MTSNKEGSDAQKQRRRKEEVRGGGRQRGLAGRQGRECATDVPQPPRGGMC